jgi:hypothetical protein
MRPFLIPGPDAFNTSGPPPLASAAYARDVDDKALGSATSTMRTQDQTESARWWHDRRSVSWEIKRQLATSQGLTALQTARRFAMTDIIVADSGMVCFWHKELWSYRRPVTAIRLADTDGNPRRGGVHFRTADVEGAKLGEAVFRYVTRRHLRPTS